MHITLANPRVESEEIQSTIGIDLDLWCYKKNMDVVRGISNAISITFYVWDFAGQVGRYNSDNSAVIHTYYTQEEYSAAHQCFITDRCLYVLCWRACDGEDGILELKEWLLTIKVNFGMCLSLYLRVCVASLKVATKIISFQNSLPCIGNF